MALLSFLALLTVPFVQAAEITSCTFDKDSYNQGEIGYITVTIYNDEETKIRVTELTATINYYYTDDNVYVQKFNADDDLPIEIQKGNSTNFNIPLSLPTNIASGYTRVYIKAVTEQWNHQSEIWFASEHLTSQPLLYIESPYKEQLEEQTTINEQLEDQLDKQQTINGNTTNMMYLFGITTVAFAAVTVFLYILNRRQRIFTQTISPDPY
jgi:hypothetical protein